MTGVTYEAGSCYAKSCLAAPEVYFTGKFWWCPKCDFQSCMTCYNKDKKHKHDVDLLLPPGGAEE